MLKYNYGGITIITEFGKILRKIRIDNDEILKNMAEKLGVSSAYLSAVEVGKRYIPEDWVTEIVDLYEINENSECELKLSYYASIKNTIFNIENSSDLKRKTALIFARTFDEIDEETIEKIFNLLHKKSEKDFI
ncbi:MAG: helix-turn-helix transcriptional regulator [Lachnospirales bacterium]